MPKYKNVIAGLAISTALTGGAVALGAATTTTTASASTATIASWGGGGCGGGRGFWRGGNRCGGGGCHRGFWRCGHNRMRIHNSNHRTFNNVRLDRNARGNDVVIG
ncbi:hypothetical protein GCM10023194_71450 [Planotetraspora phitsanulokensis]|uniref:Uncharacterized protein n=1 Tax=Planotetraspora phitsanulokensis TaxID=575192 RepID=A0A8J3XEI8_9ACTN|nr:hypothetical protein [Planotetraspora phitsanulokensis]GII37356.1 hypothetical protein Pph01_23590 [Planotetraspora phitsanulokensis]